MQSNEGSLNRRDAMNAETDKTRPLEAMSWNGACFEGPVLWSLLRVHRSAKGQNRAFRARFSLLLSSLRPLRLCGSRGARILVAAPLLQLSAVPWHTPRLLKHS